MTWSKQNLVTKSDRRGMYDEYKCSECGFRKRYYSLRRDGSCPKCSKKDISKKDISVAGCWTVASKFGSCRYCLAPFVLCQKEGHPNSKFWRLQHNENEKLVVCPNGCLEDGSYIGGRVLKRRKNK